MINVKIYYIFVKGYLAKKLLNNRLDDVYMYYFFKVNNKT